MLSGQKCNRSLVASKGILADDKAFIEYRKKKPSMRKFADAMEYHYTGPRFVAFITTVTTFCSVSGSSVQLNGHRVVIKIDNTTRPLNVVAAQFGMEADALVDETV